MFYYNATINYVIEVVNTVLSMEDCISKRTIANFLKFIEFVNERNPEIEYIYTHELECAMKAETYEQFCNIVESIDDHLTTYYNNLLSMNK